MRNKLDPEPFEVDAYLESLEWEAEKERTRKALAYVNAQRSEKPGMFISGKDFFWFFVRVLLLSAGITLVALAAFHWWLDGALRSIGL